MIGLISLYKIGVLTIFSKFLVPGIFGSEEEILQNNNTMAQKSSTFKVRRDGTVIEFRWQ